MNTEQREEIEDAIWVMKGLVKFGQILPGQKLRLSRMIDFARQQLSLRVDGEKLLEKLGVSIDHSWQGTRTATFHIPEDPAELEALVLECLTTEEKP
jgi:hypothetical protein